MGVTKEKERVTEDTVPRVQAHHKSKGFGRPALSKPKLESLKKDLVDKKIPTLRTTYDLASKLWPSSQNSEPEKSAPSLNPISSANDRKAATRLGGVVSPK